MNFIIWLIVGGVIGWLASMLMKTNDQPGMFLTWSSASPTVMRPTASASTLSDEPCHAKENVMRTPLALIALFASVLLLGACDKPPTTVPAPEVDPPVSVESVARARSGLDPSVPTTESAFPTTNANEAKPTVAVSDGERNPAQASKGLPMPGQNNDHSAPLGPAKRASSP